MSSNLSKFNSSYNGEIFILMKSNLDRCGFVSVELGLRESEFANHLRAILEQRRSRYTMSTTCKLLSFAQSWAWLTPPIVTLSNKLSDHGKLVRKNKPYRLA